MHLPVGLREQLWWVMPRHVARKPASYDGESSPDRTEVAPDYKYSAYYYSTTLLISRSTQSSEKLVNLAALCFWETKKLQIIAVANSVFFVAILQQQCLHLYICRQRSFRKQDNSSAVEDTRWLPSFWPLVPKGK
jgi:hypothetical protein